MSGIAGMIDPRLGREEGQALLEQMLQSIRHRGPDSSFSWQDMPVLLGHNRLSIIDLSARSNQPMAYHGLVIVYDGEIYNYLEIRQDLEKLGYKFNTSSDMEVILAAYREWSANCVTRFLGMWAFAIWDTAKRELFCSRDRFGIKPFYYIHSGDRFYFGSAYAPLKLSPVFDATFDFDQVSRGLRLGAACYRDSTYFKCMKALPERCNLLFKEGRVSVMPYWDIDGAKKFYGTFEEKRLRFRELFRDSVRLHMRSDVAVGGMLSGGMDSPSIVSVVGRDFPTAPFKAFTIFYEDYQMDERAWAKKVTSAYANLEPVYYSPSDQEVAEHFEAVSKAHEVPLPSSPAVSTYFVMKLAAERNVRVLLDGTGADTYLAGNWQEYDIRLISGHISTAQWLKALKLLQDVRRQRLLGLLSLGLLGLKSIAGALLSEEAIWRWRSRFQFSSTVTVKQTSSDLPSFRGSRLNQYQYHRLFHTFLPSLLHCVDRMSMAFSVECRVPFLDHRLVEFAFALDDEDKIREGQAKYILRQSMEGIVPNAVLARKDKQPFFGQEMVAWLNGPLKHLIELPMRFDGIDIIDKGEVQGIVRDFKEGDRSKVWLVWRLAMLNDWVNRD